MPDILASVWRAWLLALEGTGAAARLASFRLPLAAGARPLAATLAGVSLLLLLYAALESGPDPRVRSLRAFMLVSGLAVPLGALAAPPSAFAAYGGGALLLAALAAALHAALKRRRRAGTAERGLELARLACEGAGLALFFWGATRAALGDPVPLRLAFWSLFLLRLSVADLLQPATLVFSSGLPGSAVHDLKRAAGAAPAAGKRRRRDARAVVRASRALSGIAKGALVVLWLALPLAAAMAPAAVARGLWPRQALALRFYPPLALGGTAVVLLVRSLRLLSSAPLRGARGGLVALASLLYLVHSYRDPAFAAYRGHLPGIVLGEALFGVLLGASSRRPR